MYVRFKILSTNLIAVKMKPAEKSLLSSVSKSQKTRSIRKQRLLQRTLKKLSTLQKKKNALNLRPNQPPLNFVFPKMR